MILARRKFLIGAAASLLAAPAIVRAGSLMPVKTVVADMAPAIVKGTCQWKLLYAGVHFSLDDLAKNGLLPAQKLVRYAPDVVVI